MEKPPRHFVELEAIFEDFEIRGITVHFPSGPVEGFRWRYRVIVPPRNNERPRDEMTKWVFASRESVGRMLEAWQRYLRDGTLGPGTQVQ